MIIVFSGSVGKVRSSVETVHTGMRAALFGLPQNNPIALLVPSLLLAGAGNIRAMITLSSSLLFLVAFYFLLCFLFLYSRLPLLFLSIMVLMTIFD
jgi:hypothetical protein